VDHKSKLIYAGYSGAHASFAFGLCLQSLLVMSSGF